MSSNTKKALLAKPADWDVWNSLVRNRATSIQDLGPCKPWSEGQASCSTGTRGTRGIWCTRRPNLVQPKGLRSPQSKEGFLQDEASQIAVAQFFEATCSAIFNNLLHANSLDGGLFGPISTYFGTLETNGRGMLHLHCLVWLKGAFHLSKLRQRLLSDPEYTDRVVEFIDQIIKCHPLRQTPLKITNLRTVDGTTLSVYGAYEASDQVRDHFGTASTTKQVFLVFAGET